MIRSISFLALTWLCTFACLAHAEDIDLFKGGGAQDPAPPNVLIILDNTSNWSSSMQGQSLTRGQTELAALKRVLNDLVCSSTLPMKVNVGLMMLQPNKGTYQDTTSGVSGFLRRAVLPLSKDLPAGNTRCNTFINDLEFLYNNNQSATYKAAANANYGGAMLEAFKYFGGYTNPGSVASNTVGTPVGHTSFGPLRFSLREGNSAKQGNTTYYLEEDAAFEDTPTNSKYISPITSLGSGSSTTCTLKNYILIVGNAWPNADTENSPILETTLSFPHTKAPYAQQFPFATGPSPRIADAWARFLSTTDVSSLAGQQRISTSVIDVIDNADQTKLLKSIALHGQGSYYSSAGTLDDLVASFRNFFVSINAANQAFAPSILAPSASSGGLDINQVYLGMFRPDKNPRWFGNLKLYQLVLNGTKTDGAPNIYLGDSAGNPARSTSGFITDNAISFWTQPYTQNLAFWTFRCGSGSSVGDPLLCGSAPPLSALQLPLDSPDGPVVEKGGAGQKLRISLTADNSNSGRIIYTDNGTSRIDFNTSTVTTSQVGVTTTAERDLLVNWVRGVDNVGENPVTANGPRPSMTGDVLHSEPVAVNYGTTTGGCSSASTGDVVVYYAGNDGMLHALSGGKNEGTELWSYIPSKFLGNLKRLRDNAPAVTFPGPVPATSFNKPYLLDGNLSVYAPDADGNCKPDKVWLFLTMRRGGRHIYALDVTSKSDPKMLWYISCSKTVDTDSCTNSSFTDRLGQTWSKLTPMQLANNKLALIFGAGYDPSAEDRPFSVETGTYGNAAASTRAMGKGVFVISLGTTGQIEGTQFFNGGTYSFPSDVSVVSDVNTGYAERAYIGDTGGNLWRISFRDTSTSAITADSSKWSMTQIAALGNDQKFLYPPDIARCGGQDVLLIGSGNREEPFDRAIPYRFYQIQDPTSGSVGLTDLTNVSTLGTQPDPNKKGWYFNLAAGEKTVGRALTQSGTTYFPTNEAANNSGSECSTSLGTARLYGVSCSTGGPSVYALDSSGQPTARYETIAGGGFPPSPTSTVVKLTDANGQTKTLEAILSGSHVAGGRFASTKRKFTYWYREGLD